MATRQDPYQTAALKNKTNIRLLTLHNASAEQVIKCSLATADLLHNPAFEALSYCWDTPENPRRISLNGQDVEVRKNLWWALRHLRDKYKDRILRVDALCINQYNTEERNHQVGMMGAIYSIALVVHVWLGLGTHEALWPWIT